MHPLPECPSNAVLHVQWANMQPSFIVARDAAMMFQPCWAVVCAEYPQSLGAMLGAEVDQSLQQLERLARHSRFGFAALPLRLAANKYIKVQVQFAIMNLQPPPESSNLRFR